MLVVNSAGAILQGNQEAALALGLDQVEGGGRGLAELLEAAVWDTRIWT
jgi:hypothetical protein